MEPPDETLRRVVPSGSEGSAGTPGVVLESWWGRFAKASGGLTLDAQDVLADDSALLTEMVAPRDAAQAIDTASWPASRVRTGIVVGAVQSGKTASMLALSARLLDRGVGALVLLSGTRIALWLQTYERVLAQLDGSSKLDAWRKNKLRVLVPDPNDVLDAEPRAEPRAYLSSKVNAMQRAVATGCPLIFVVPKQDDHLLHLQRTLEHVLSSKALTHRGTPFELVVLDDEADDASVLDARESEKITPRFIQDLWTNHASAGQTWNPLLYATYVAYTATPQANFLQATHNPLSPRDFEAVLRVPAADGDRLPRQLTFREREGIQRYYTGGRFFYELLRDRPGDPSRAYQMPARTVNDTDGTHEARVATHRLTLLGDALRAYFVAAAMRLHQSGKRYSNLGDARPLAELRGLLPATHSMLFHPSALRDRHFEGAEAIARWCSSKPGEEAGADPPRDERGEPLLSVAGLFERLRLEEPAWKQWLLEYASTVDALRMERGGQAYPDLRAVPWLEIRELLENEIFPHAKMRVLNSDPRADDRPRFQPIESSDDGELFHAPPDLLSIFVAGNVLSRGLTIEGLCTSLFLRSANEPAADTQMQMQRWFGYRGAHLPLCRLFVYSDQLALFRAYQTNDEALKTGVLGRMSVTGTGTRDALVLQGDAFLATSKVDSRRAPLSPGPTPSIKLVEHKDPLLAASNLERVASLWSSRKWTALSSPDGIARGHIGTEPMTMLEVTTFLEDLRYSHHAPDPANELYARWGPLAAMVGTQPLLFLPNGASQTCRVSPSACPYSIAAYLRLWAGLLARPQVPGFYPTDRPDLPWHMQTLTSVAKAEPRFYVGIRGGSAGSAAHAALAAGGVTSLKRQLNDAETAVETLWGTRGTEGMYYGDQLFDYHFHGTSPVPRLHEDSLWRPSGHPGLLLIHLIRHPSLQLDMVSVGLAFPRGGPDHIAALRTS